MLCSVQTATTVMANAQMNFVNAYHIEFNVVARPDCLKPSKKRQQMPYSDRRLKILAPFCNVETSALSQQLA